MLLNALLVAGGLAATAAAQTAGSVVEVGQTTVSAMMVLTALPRLPFFAHPVQMFLGNEEKVYILDKAEGNPTKIGTHPAWGAVW